MLRSNSLANRRKPLIPRWLLVVAVLLGTAGFNHWSPTSGLIAQDEAPVNALDQTETAQADHTTDASAEHAGAEGSSDAAAQDHPQGHTNPVAPLLAAIVLLLFFAKVMGDMFERVGMPAVLGELVVGIILGNIAFMTGWGGLEFLHAPPEHELGNPYHPGAALKLLAEIGVVLLLFEVGLETNITDMINVGASSLLVAVLGVIAPMILGLGVGYFLLSHESWQVWLFLGATLCATSVGITARVLKDLGRAQQRESKIILGAAVIDDVLGLIVLTVVVGIISQGDNFEISSLFKIVGMSVGFLAVAVLLGTTLITKPLFKAASYLRGHGLLVTTSLVICFGAAYLATLVQLAPIIGAFAAGLILEKAQYQELGKKENIELEEALAPLTAMLVPIFFVQMGTQVKMESFMDSSVWLLAGAITVAAIIGKQVCTFGVLEKGLNKTAVGLGMIPRGEVGLIFAGVGHGLRANGHEVVSNSTYSAIVVMVILTTMITPPLLKWSMNQPVKSEAT